MTDTNTDHGGAVAWRLAGWGPTKYSPEPASELIAGEWRHYEPLYRHPTPQTDTDAREKVVEAAAERVGFKAGWAARTRAIDEYLMRDVTPDVDAAWSNYEPQGAHVAADILIDRLQERLDSYAGSTRAYVDVLDFQALINRARLAALKTGDA